VYAARRRCEEIQEERAPLGYGARRADDTDDPTDPAWTPRAVRRRGRLRASRTLTVPWVEVFAVVLVSHAVGDFLLQTGWQATYKRGGLGPDPVRRRALLAHVTTYTLAFVPALAWLAGELGPGGTVALAAGVFLPHLVQDDGRLLSAYVRSVKHTEPAPGMLMLAVDQSFHLVVLFGLALAAGT
jgi:hypothetical protein